MRRKLWKKTIAAFACSAMVVTAFSGCGQTENETNTEIKATEAPADNNTDKPAEETPAPTEAPAATETPAVTETPAATPTPTATPVPTEVPDPVIDLSIVATNPANGFGELTGKTSQEVVAQMGIGYNIGNTLDAKSGANSTPTSHERAWGNPSINQDLIDGIAAAGFTTVRIPTTWESFISKDGNYTINPEYLARVQEVVDYCYAQNLYIILNLHHEGWLENKNMVKDKEKIGLELETVWTQIANYFAEYDQHLIFEGMNEPRLSGTNIEWSGNSEAYQTINYYNQLFANAVRSNGRGHNDERCLMIPGYAASNSASVEKCIAIPTFEGEAVKNIVISVHSYSPYDFCLSTKQSTFDLNNPSDTGQIDQVFASIADEFLSQGIPVVLGETGATGKEDVSQRVNWATYMSRKAVEYGVPIVLWDNGVGGTTNESHKYFERATGELIMPEFVGAMIDNKNNLEWGSAVKANSTDSGSAEPAESTSYVNGDVIYSYPDGLTSVKDWDYTYISGGCSELYFSEGSSIAVVYSGAGEPKMVFDSAELEQWWMPVDATSIEELGDKKVAYFSKESMDAVLQSFGVTAYSQIRNMNFLSANGSITTYEVSVVGGSYSVLFYVNGNNYYLGSDMPADPELEGFKFLGWYSTKDYREGTEYTGGALNGNITVYAKFGLEK